MGSMQMYKRRRKSPFKQENELDLTSLMDVVFLILIFFMVTATFVKEKKTFKVELEKAKNATDQKLVKEALTITISKEGNYAINEQMTGLFSRREILDQLKNYKDKNEMVVIKGDKDAPFGAYVHLEDVLNELKIYKKSLVVKKGGN
jgi:biopolymer transport protein ExbD